MSNPLQVAFRALCLSLMLPLAMFVAANTLPHPPPLAIAHLAASAPKLDEPAFPTKLGHQPNPRTAASTPPAADHAIETSTPDPTRITTAEPELVPERPVPGHAPTQSNRERSVTPGSPHSAANSSHPAAKSDETSSAKHVAEELAVKLSLVEEKLRTLDEQHRLEIARLEQQGSQRDLDIDLNRVGTTPGPAPEEGPTPIEPSAEPQPIKVNPRPTLPAPSLPLPVMPLPPVAPVPQQAERGIRHSRSREGNLNMQLHEADLGEVLTIIGEHFHQNIVAGRGVTGRVTATLTEAELDEALDVVLRSDDFVTRTTNNAIVVLTRSDALSRDQQLKPLTTRLYVARYLNANDLRQLVTPFLTPGWGRATTTVTNSGLVPGQGGAGQYASSTNVALRQQQALVVQDTVETLENIDRIVRELDVPPQQIVLDVLLLRVELTDRQPLGVDFNSLSGAQQDRLISPLGIPPAGDNSLRNLEPPSLYGIGSKAGLLRTTNTELLERLRKNGTTTVVASPSLVVINKEQADLTIQKRAPAMGGFNGQVMLSAGSQIRLRPDLGADGLIKLRVQPDQSPGSTQSAGVSTQVETLLHDGQTLVLGGLFDETIAPTKSKSVTDVLKGKGWLDRRPVVTRWEILTLITPRLIRDMAPSTTALGRPTLLNGDVTGKPFAATTTRLPIPTTRNDVDTGRPDEIQLDSPLRSSQQPWTSEMPEIHEPQKLPESIGDPESKPIYEDRVDSLNQVIQTRGVLVPPVSAPLRR